MITDEVRESLHNDMTGILSECECPRLAINSVADHVHVLLLFQPVGLMTNATFARLWQTARYFLSGWSPTTGAYSAGT